MLCLLLPLLQTPGFEFDVRSGDGLRISVQGIPIVQGSWFQYYAPNWSKGFYSSQYNDQQITKPDNDTVQLTFTSPDKLASGKILYHRQGDKLTAHYEFSWSGEEAAKVELTSGLLWAPALENGSLTVDSKPARSLLAKTYDANSSRDYGSGGKEYQFTLPFGSLSLSSTAGLNLFDARNDYPQDWARGKQLWWAGAPSLDLEKGKTTSFDLTWEIKAKPNPAPSTQTLTAKPVDTNQAKLPDESQLPLVPYPSKSKLNYDEPTEFTTAFNYPVGTFDHCEQILQSVGRRYVLPKPTPSTPRMNLDGGQSKLGLAPGGYKLTITRDSISILGEEDEGLRNGVQRLANLVYAKGGKLWIPTGTLVDEPRTAWRGVHLFVGPNARSFQTKLWDRVLSPLMFNKVVLQCERTDWKSLPGIKTPITMSREELANLFQMYRNRGVEPIPLIQSFGHMEWIFANKQNLNIAFNPEVPYSVDPRKERTEQVLRSLWSEAIGLLKPDTIHFGLDEVDMLGWPHDPALVTQLWTKQLPLLGDIAIQNKKRMMLWGDKGLAPGEAVDATLGDTPADAKARRDVIPKGAYIGDWHYKSETKPEEFAKSIRLWKNNGLRPIASSWYLPENVRAFNIAATTQNVGTLQTTWCGYESNERSVVDAFEQFAPMVLAADYSWSGRQEPLKDLPYDFNELFRKLYFGVPSELKPLPGQCVPFTADAESMRIGRVNYLVGPPLALKSLVVSSSYSLPNSIAVDVQARGKTIAIAMDCALPCEEGAEVATVEVVLDEGKTLFKKIVYGRDVRARTDTRPTLYCDRKNGISSFEIGLSEKVINIKRVLLKTSNNFAGLRVHGMTTIGR